MKIRILYCVVVLLFLFSCARDDAYASTISAASCSQADVQAAINKASDGDLVSVPAGACTWATPLSFCKAITLAGAGSSLTTVTANIGTGFGKDAIFINGCQNKSLIRITGFTFQNMSSDNFGLIYFYLSAGTTVRIDHNTFAANGQPGRAITVSGSFGVVDNNPFTDMGLLAEGTQSGDKNQGDSSWTQAMSLGKVNALYVENNVMNYPTTPVDLDCDDGGRIVYRFNTVSGNGIGNHGFDSVPRGCMELDAYNNTIIGSGTAFIGVQYRGASGVVYNNLIQGTFTGNRFAVTNYRSTSGGFTTHDYCDGTSPNDQNTLPLANNHGWACRDQVGRGTNQGSFPLYEWNNCITSLGCTPGGGDAVSIVVYQAGGGTSYLPQHIQSNRDYYDAVASFSGTSGVGQGTLAARPGTCTPNVGYWATDTNVLYACTAANTWAPYYAPVTYPHPLQSGQNPPQPPGPVTLTVH
jgi:hypothetical protein